MITNSKTYILTIVILIAIFGVYNFIFYNDDGFVPVEKSSSEAVKSQQLFQNNRCRSCRQLNGLGSYLDPDLINIYSDKGKGPNIKTFCGSSGARNRESGAAYYEDFKYLNRTT